MAKITFLTLNNLKSTSKEVVENAFNIVYKEYSYLVFYVVLQIVNTLTSPEQLTNLLNASLVMLMELANGLVDAIPQLVDAINQIVMNIGLFLTDPKNIEMILGAALKIIVALGKGVLKAIPVFLQNMLTFYEKIFENFKNYDWGSLGKNLVDGFTAEGFGVGFEDEFAHVRDDMEKAMTFDDMAVDIGSSVRHVGGVSRNAYASGYGGTQDVNVTVTIDENVNAMGLARELLPYLKIAAQEAYA